MDESTQKSELISQGESSPKTSSKHKIIAIVALALLLFVGLGSYLWQQNRQTKTGIALEPTPLPKQPTISTDIYTNPTYNFSFEYPDDVYYEKFLASHYTLTDHKTSFTITQIVYNSDHTTSEFPTEYTLYPATTKDRTDLLGWWKRTHATDFKGYTVPEGYDTSLNTAPFIGCIKASKKDWTLPPSLEVLAKGAMETDAQEAAELPGATEEPIDPTRVIYLYYDFGKPFILRFQEPFDGGCGEKDTYKVVTTIHKLR